MKKNYFSSNSHQCLIKSLLAIIFLVGFISNSQAQSHTFATYSPGTLTSGTTGVSNTMTVTGLTGDYLYYDVSANFVGTGNVAWSNSIQMEISNGGAIIHKELSNATSGAMSDPSATTLHWTGVLSRKYAGGNNLVIRFFDSFNDASGPYTSDITNVIVTLSQPYMANTFPGFAPGTVTSNTAGVSTALTTTGLTGDYMFYNVTADFVGTGNVAWSDSMYMEISDGGTLIYKELSRANSGWNLTPDATTLHWNGVLAREYVGGGNLTIRFFDNYHDASGPYTSDISAVNVTISQVPEPHTFPMFAPGTVTSNTTGVSTAMTTTGLTEDYLFYNVTADFVGTGNPAWSDSIRMEINDGGTVIYQEALRATSGWSLTPDATTLHWTGVFTRVYTGGGSLTVRFFDNYHDASGPYTSSITNASVTLGTRGSNLICPTVGAVSASVPDICQDMAFDLVATSLTDMGVASNGDQDFGIEFVAFTTTPADPYAGGTSLGTVPFGSLNTSGTNANFTGATLAAAGAHEIYAILSPTPTDPTCRPSAMTNITINENPTVVASFPAFCDNTTTVLTAVGSGGSGTYSYEWFSGTSGDSGSVVLNPSKDNSMYSLNPGNSNGSGTGIFAGRTFQPSNHRALIGFDLSSIPTDVIITNASLQLYCDRTISGAEAYDLHVLTADWGEGASVAPGQGGSGTPGIAPDATWDHSMIPSSLWTNPGGDFNLSSSASTMVSGQGTNYTWTSAQMNIDVQSWVTTPANNFGWLLKGQETTDGNSKRFSSREHATMAQRPALTVDYDAVSLGTGNTLSNVSPGSYTVVATDTNGCSSSFTIVVATAVTTYTGGAWDNGAPNLVTKAVINDVLNTGGTSIEACSCDVNGDLIIDNLDYLLVNGDINVVGFLGVDITGSVVQIDDAATAMNNGIMAIVKQTPVMAAQSFMIIGSPMTMETREGVFGANYIVRNHVTANFVPNPAVEILSPGINNWADDDGNNWLNHSGLLNPGEGYLVFPQPDGSSSGSYLQFHELGTLNNGVINVNLGFNADQNSSPNIMANPYASAIDAEVFFDNPANSGIDVVYFWEHLTAAMPGYPGYAAANFSMGDISMYSESLGAGVAAANGGAVPTQYIASGQGFGVKPAAGGTAQFNNAMRVTGPNDNYRSNEIVGRDRLWINAHNDTYGLGSNVLIGFTENTSDGFIISEDVYRLPTPVSLYSELETGEELVVNALGTFETTDAIYLSFTTQVKEIQDYRISIDNFDGVNLEAATVYLIDSLIGSVTNLSEGDYTFQSGEAIYHKRFKVVFENSALGIDDSNLDSVSVYPNPTQNVVNIVSPQTIVTSATIYDIRGRKVSEVDFRNQSTYQIDMSKLEAAIYFVEIATESGTVTKRVMKK